jgi:hypothetical protein
MRTQIPGYRLETPDIRIGHVLGHREISGLPLNNFIFRFQLLVGLERTVKERVQRSIMRRARQAPLRFVEPVA